MPPDRPQTTDVVVVGAGVIGLGIAWRAAQRGLGVTVVDPAPGSGASQAAAGMLAPVSELHYGEQALLTLNLDSARRYPAFVEELQQVSGQRVGYLRCGTVQAAWDGADLAGLRDLQHLRASLGLESQLLTGRELRALEPGTAAGLPGGLLAIGDHQVDNRLLHAALGTAATMAGATHVAARVHTVRCDDGGVTGVELDDGHAVACRQVVLAGGCWSRDVAGLPDEVRPPVRPVKGQTLRLRSTGEPMLRHILRGSVRGNLVYLVPREDGRLVVGASSEEAGFDLRPRAGAVYELLRDAQALLPAVTETELEEVATGLRPGSPDNAPVVGPGELAGLVVATGHYRNGVLLTPVTADGVAAVLAGEALPDVLAPFGPSRFSTREVLSCT